MRRVVLLLSLVSLLVGCPGPSTHCGPGTHDDGKGACVPDGVITCGPGTHEQGGQCVPDSSGNGSPDGGSLSCGPGTHIENGQCVPDARGDGGSGGLSCGPGTHLEGSQCLPGDAIDSIEVLPASASARVGVPVPFTATARYQGNVVDGVSFTWATQNASIATIDSSGTAQGVAAGSTQITASARGVTSAPATLTVQPGPAFQLSSIVPASAPGGAAVTLNGTRFGLTQGNTQVRFGSTVADTVLSWSDTQIVVRVPFGMVPGQLDVTLSEPSGTSNAVAFTVLNTPYVLSVTPASVVRGSKVTLSLSGSNLGTCSVALYRNGAVDADSTVNSSSKIVDRSGAPNLPDLVRVDVDVSATAQPGDRAVGCGSSTTAVNADNRFSVVFQPGTIAAAAGDGTAGLEGDNGSATVAKLNGPSALALGRSGELYIADTGNHRVRVYNPTAGTLTVAGVDLAAGSIMTLAGGGGVATSTAPGLSGNGGPAIQSQLDTPSGLAYDPRGLLFIADTNNHCVRVVNVSAVPVTLSSGSVAAGNIALVAGACGLAGYFGDGGAALPNSRFTSPAAVAVDGSGLLYVADTGNNKVRVVNTSTTTVTNALGTLPSGRVALVAGSSAGNAGDGSQAGSSTQLNAPAGLALVANGLLYVADTGNNKVRVINPTATALAFGGLPVASGGLGTTVGPGVITTAVGQGGAAGFSGDGWPCSPRAQTAYSFYNQPCAPLAMLAAPTGLATGPQGELFIADQNNNRVRLAPVGDSPLFRAGAWFYSGGINTIAGNGQSGSTSGNGDNGTAASANVFGPLGVAYDANRAMLYVADTLHHRVRGVLLDLPRDPFSGELGTWPSDLTSGTATLDVDTGILSYTTSSGSVQQRLGVTGGVFSFNGPLRIFTGTTLEIVGTRPAVLAATGDVTIDGKVLAKNGVLASGPGLMYPGGTGHGGNGGSGRVCNANTAYDYDGGAAYGNATLIPVTPGTYGTGGGGALVLSAGKEGRTANLRVAGEVRADAGTTPSCDTGTSGGGLRLVATGQVSISGTLSAQGDGGPGCCIATYRPQRFGSGGRIRLEAPTVTATGSVIPAASILSAPPLAPPWM